MVSAGGLPLCGAATSVGAAVTMYVSRVESSGDRPGASSSTATFETISKLLGKISCMGGGRVVEREAYMWEGGWRTRRQTLLTTTVLPPELPEFVALVDGHAAYGRCGDAEDYVDNDVRGGGRIW